MQLYSKDQGNAIAIRVGFVALGSLAIGLLLPTRSEAQEPTFLRGDANADGRVSIADAVMVRRFVFNGEEAPPCLDAADADDNGRLQLTDSVRILLNFFPNRSADWGTTAIAESYPEIGPDSTSDDLNCTSSGIVPAEETQDLIRIGTIEAAPGEEVAVPVFLTNSVDVDAIQIVMKYDPELFTPAPHPWFDYEGTFYQFLDDAGSNGFASLQGHPADGILAIGIVGDIVQEGAEVPPGNDTLLIKFRGVVSPTAVPGSTILLEPTNGPDGQGVKPPILMRNELTHHGESRFVVTLPKTVPGLIGIVDDVTFFVRGDANLDATVNIADPVFTLSYLFLGGKAPTCADAADADDNGKLELSDAVSTLTYLFVGSAALPPPSSAPGGDPSPDDLPRCRD